MLEAFNEPNVLYCDFTPSFVDTLYSSMKRFGVGMVYQSLLVTGFKKSVAKALIRKVMRERGW